MATPTLHLVAWLQLSGGVAVHGALAMPPCLQQRNDVILQLLYSGNHEDVCIVKSCFYSSIHCVIISWLIWFDWKQQNGPWHGTELSVDDMDRALFAAATRVTIKDGKTARFWTSSWRDGRSPASIFPNLFKHAKRKNRSVAEALQDDRWITDISHDLTTDLLSEYVVLWGLIADDNFNPVALNRMTSLGYIQQVENTMQTWHITYNLKGVFNQISRS